MRLLGLEGIQGNNLTFEQTSGLRNFADANIYEGSTNATLFNRNLISQGPRRSAPINFNFEIGENIIN